MPELPEIETIRRGLLEKVLKRPILKVEVNNAGVIRNRKEKFIKALEGKSFVGVERRGKMLILEIEKDKQEDKQHFLLARLGMTGRLVYFGEEDTFWGGNSFEKKNTFSHRHCHVALRFRDDSVLLYCDMRRFGNLEIVDKATLEHRLENFGPEPLQKDFTLPIFHEIVEGKKTNIKALLLNQKYIAGIGNIYADEILFDSKVLPGRVAGSLSLREIEAIYASIKKILRNAIRNRGTTFSDYVDSGGRRGNYKIHLKVYGRGGEQCLNCKTGKIRKTKIAGRGTSFCHVCQK